MAASSPTTPQASGCLALFGVPFALGGCLAVGKLIGELTSPYPNWTQVWPLAICSAAMLTIGFGLIAATIFARKQQRATDALRAASPDSPWMWRADWAQGRVRSAEHTSELQSRFDLVCRLLL